MAPGTEKFLDTADAELWETQLELQLAHMDTVERELRAIRQALEALREIAEPARGWRLPIWLRHRQ